jgi:hypothetical protein
VLGIAVEEQDDTAELWGGIDLKNAKGMCRFMPLTEAVVACYLTKNAVFVQWRRDRHGEDIADEVLPPGWLVRAVAGLGRWPGIRPIQYIASCPFVRDNGSFPIPGYDATTRTLYRPSVDIGPISPRPTRDDAMKAAHELYQVVRQFPFADVHDKCAWLAAFLTAIQRPVIDGPVPGFVFNANKAGTGKGLLIDIIGIVAFGHPIPTRPYPMDPIEADKVKLSLALSGVQAVHFDNLPEGGFFGNSALDTGVGYRPTSRRSWSARTSAATWRRPTCGSTPWTIGANSWRTA